LGKAKVKNKQGFGDCYEVHGRFIMDGVLNKSLLSDTHLCHGSVFAPDVGRHGHCWIELGNDVVMDISNGHSFIGRRDEYYRVGQVKSVKRYTPEEARNMVLKYGHWGDWSKPRIKNKAGKEK
jgi:hypothetical protein